jgi:tetratricopeptide (TPR) repeat protein
VSSPGRKVFITLLLLFFTLTTPALSLGEVGSWSSVRSENFLVVGDVKAEQLSSVAERLEEFRSVFSQVMEKGYFEHRAPTVVLVFANEAEYDPFRPLVLGQRDQFVAGYFKSTPDVNYITLAARSTLEETASIVFHEYVHSLVKNRYGQAPVWFDEGLAEYYSAYELTGDKQRVRVGKRLAGRVESLRTHALLPLDELLTADRLSPLYNERDRSSIFYAQSWALVHYLLSDKTGERARQLSQFLNLLAAGNSVEDGVRQAFQVEMGTLEDRLREYVRAGQYTERLELLSSRPGRSAAVAFSRLSQAQAEAHLGDLLLRTERPEEARPYLERALTLDPQLAAAHLSLGILHLSEGALTEAVEHLRKAIATAPQSYLAHYYYAESLRREASEADNSIAGYHARTALIKAELERVIELAPTFLDAYGLLALVQIERGPELVEATRLIEYIMREAPGRQEFKLLLAQLYLRREEFAHAREELFPLVRNGMADQLVRAEARTILERVGVAEALAAERAKQDETMLKQAAEQVPLLPCDMPAPGPQLKPVRFAGQQVCGRLVRIECEDSGILLFVETSERTLKLHTETFKRIRFVTYTSEIKGRVECGERTSAQPVLITYNPTRGDSATFDGELTAVEFVPEDWLR